MIHYLQKGGLTVCPVTWVASQCTEMECLRNGIFTLKSCSVRLFRRCVKASLSLSSGWLLHKLVFHMLYAATGNGASAMFSPASAGCCDIHFYLWQSYMIFYAWSDATLNEPLSIEATGHRMSVEMFFSVPDGWLQNSLGPTFLGDV